MTGLIERLLGQRKLVFTVAALVSLIGIVTWQTMTRQEDPHLPSYWGQAVASFPGADAETVERLVLEPIEEHLAEVEQIKFVDSTAYVEMAVLNIELRDSTRDIDEAWDDVRDALREAAVELPAGVAPPSLDDHLSKQESLVYALTGDADPLVLDDAAEALKHELLTIPGVSEVRLIAPPGEQVVVELDEATGRRLGLTGTALAGQLAERSHIVPGGDVVVAGRSVALRPQTDYRNLDDLRTAPIRLPSGEMVPLEAIARVRRGPIEPTAARMRFNGEAAVGLGVVPEEGINIVAFGERVRAAMVEIAPTLAPLEVHEAVFQPDRVAWRLRDLSGSLVSGALMLGALLLLVMGPRMGLVVTAVVPIAAFSTIAVFGLGGGVLHQISIAALIIALGGLVDNAIVVAEAMQFRLDHGESGHQAATGAVRELAGPMAAAGLTSMAAFVPMAIAPGTTSEFTRAIPFVCMLAVVLSYVLAVTFTPALGEVFLRRRSEQAAAAGWLERVADRLGMLAVHRPALVLAAGTGLLALSFALLPFVRLEFFPSSDRNQLVVDLRLPDGTHLERTDAAAIALERALLAREDVVAVTSYVGRGVPHFYYNLDSIPWSPSRAQLVVDTTSTRDLPALLQFVRTYGRDQLPAGEIVARRLEQGPPIAAPVALRVLGSEPGEIADAVEQVVSALRATPGATDVRHSLSTGTPMVELIVDDAAAARRGLTRADIGRSLYGRTRGLPVGELRDGEDPVPIVVRSPQGQERPIDDLPAIDIESPVGPAVPLGQVATLAPVWKPASIDHRNRRRVVTVSAELADEATYSDVMRALAPKLAALTLPKTVEIEVAGAAESSGEANTAMAQAVPVGLLLLVGVLVGQFHSFRRAGLVLLTVPLAATGVIPGLLIGNQPFGFMSLLGVISLAGVVINNSILLLESIDERRAAGKSLLEAVHGAVERRARPILLTAFMTVVGLIPLAFSPTTLWPPLAWAMISGLLAATLLTLLLLPALYVLFFAPREVFARRRPPEPGEQILVGTALVLGLLLGAAPGWAQVADSGVGSAGSSAVFAPATESAAAAELANSGSGSSVPASSGMSEAPAVDAPSRAADGVEGLTLDDVLRAAAERPEVLAAGYRATAAAAQATAEHRAAVLPVLEVGVATSERDRTLELETPIGNFPFGASRAESAEVLLVQPLFVPGQLLYAAPAARRSAAAADLAARRVRQQAAAAAAGAWIEVRSLDARLAATRAFVASLEARLGEVDARVAAGRSLAADALKVALARDRARQEETALLARRAVAVRELGRAVGRPEASVEPAGEPDADDSRLRAGAGDLDPARLIAEAQSARLDRAALLASVEAAELRRRATRAEWLPRLEATGRYTWSNGSPYAQEDWIEGSIRLAWNPLAAGTRAARLGAQTAGLDALRGDLAALDQDIAHEVRSALAAITIAEGRLELGESGVAMATETLRVEQERHAAGRVTTNDLLAAEAELRDQRTLRDVARLELLGARVALGLAVGWL